MNAVSHTPRAVALTLLARRARTSADLRRRLERKGFEAGEIEATVTDLVRTGVVDDRAFARAWARGRAERRLLGPRAVRADLLHQGVSTELAETVVGELYAELDERALASRLAERSAPVDLPARRRLSARLARRGFSPEIIRQVLRMDEDPIEAGRTE